MTHIPGTEAIVCGTSSNDKLKGKKTDDSIYGRAGDDLANGKHGDDYLVGGAGDDRLKGGQDDDWILGGADANILQGGQGADQFRVTGRDGAAINLIKDLDFDEGDSLVLSNFFAGTFDDKDGFLETGVGNDLDITGGLVRYGEGAVIDSVADLVELVKFSDGARALQGKGNTLILELTNGSTTQTIYLKHHLNDFISAGGEFLI